MPPAAPPCMLLTEDKPKSNSCVDEEAEDEEDLAETLMDARSREWPEPPAVADDEDDEDEKTEKRFVADADGGDMRTEAEGTCCCATDAANSLFNVSIPLLNNFCTVWYCAGVMTFLICLSNSSMPTTLHNRMMVLRAAMRLSLEASEVAPPTILSKRWYSLLFWMPLPNRGVNTSTARSRKTQAMLFVTLLPMLAVLSRMGNVCRSEQC